MGFDIENRLLNKARQGDVQAFEELSGTCYTKVYNICYRMLGNPDDAWEQAQETFIKAFKYIKDFKGNCTFSTWIYRIATNTCLDYIRKNKNKNTVSIEQETYEDITLKDRLVSSSPGPEKIAELNAQKAALKEALSRMNEKNRIIVVLRDFMGLSYEEISESLELPIGTVKSRISRARTELKELLCNSEEHLFTDYVR